MEQWLTQGVISGVLANSLTTIVTHIGDKSEKIVRQLFRENPALDRTLKKAISKVTDAIEIEDHEQVTKLKLFLSSPDVEAIVRQIYANKLTSDDDANNLESLRTEFLSCLSLYLGESQKNLKELEDKLFDVLLEGCDDALKIAIDNGFLFAHEAKSSIRHRMILDELATIKKNIVFLNSEHKPNVQTILEFEKKYLQQVASRHEKITPPYFDVARKLPIDDIFVLPKFVSSRKTGTISEILNRFRRPKLIKPFQFNETVQNIEEPTTINMEDFLSGIYRAVLLGNPGAGKSTISLKICHDLATRRSDRIFAGRNVTPILVILRDYGAEKKVSKCSILQFIETTANSTYQVQPPPGTFEYLFLNGRAVVIFDGLDEMLDTNCRQEISGDIESFCTLYPSVPVIVTSREVGYEQAPLDEKRFEIFRLSPFDDAQVKEYANKWFSVDSDLTHEQQKQKITAFLEESQTVSDLRSNPLMLALMCNIYRGENYIPKNRTDVYEKCSIMLFDRWDKNRGIHAQLPFETDIKPSMMYLAYWIYSDESLQGGVTEKNLIHKAAQYLFKRRFEDLDEAENAAREFIEFCRGRAWVFTDTGSTKEEPLYQFTHRTFLEYFTAAYLVRTHPTPETLGAFLLPKIAKNEWDVIAQLAFQIQNRTVEGAGDDLLTALIKQVSKTENDGAWNLLSFAARCLEFMVPSPKVTRIITTKCIQRSFTWKSKGVKRKKSSKHPFDEFIINEFSRPTDTISNLLNSAKENRMTVKVTLENLLIERIKGENETESFLSYEILKIIKFNSIMQNEVVSFWKEVFDHIIDTCSDGIAALCPMYFEICYDSFRKGEVSPADLVKWHGINSLFNVRGYTFVPNTFSPSPAEVLLDTLFLIDYTVEEQKLHLRQLQEIGYLLFSLSPPWIIKQPSFDRFPWIQFSFNSFDKKQKGELRLNPETLFGAFVLIAAGVEVLGDKEIVTKIIKKSKDFLLKFITMIVIARFDQKEIYKVQSEMDVCDFTDEQQAFIWRWIRREVDFVKNVAE